MVFCNFLRNEYLILSYFGQAAKTAQKTNVFRRKTDKVEPLLTVMGVLIEGTNIFSHLCLHLPKAKTMIK